MYNDGEKLRYALKSLEITQDEAAKALGVSRMTVNTWCNRAVLDFEIRQKINQILHIDLSNDKLYLPQNRRLKFDFKTFRSDRGLTQKDIVDVLEITQPYASELENGYKLLPKHLYEKLLAKYGPEIEKYIKNDVPASENSFNEKIAELESSCKVKDAIIEGLYEKIKLLEERIKDKDQMINVLQKNVCVDDKGKVLK
jgi:transcriptional regulator with XRE-family HTH domain